MITVYGSATCVPCRNTKKFLTTKGIDFTYVDITTDADSQVMLEEMGYTGIPVIVTDNDTWVGFNREKLSALQS